MRMIYVFTGTGAVYGLLKPMMEKKSEVIQISCYRRL